MTANAMKGDRERCLASGMDGYVSKPVKRDALFAEIKRFMESASPESEPPETEPPETEPPETEPTGKPSSDKTDRQGSVQPRHLSHRIDFSIATDSSRFPAVC